MKVILWRGILAVSCQLLAVSWVWACPRCVEATPFKIGLQWAIVVLLPLPFAMGYLLYRFLRSSMPSNRENPSQG